MASGKVVWISVPEGAGKIKEDGTGDIYDFEFPEHYKNGNDINSPLVVPDKVTFTPGGGLTASDIERTNVPTACKLTANPEVIPRGESFTLSWETTNAISAAITGAGAPGSVQLPSGFAVVVPRATTTYTLTVTNATGQDSDDATVTVR